MKLFKKHKADEQNIERLKAAEQHIEYLKEAVDVFMARNNSLDDCVHRCERILKNYLPGKITYVSDGPGVDVEMFPHCYKTYIYKDGQEFKINGLVLLHPEFKESENDGAIFVTDFRESSAEQYVIDLDKCTFIKIK